jgi:hypothetical protein
MNMLKIDLISQRLNCRLAGAALAEKQDLGQYMHNAARILLTAMRMDAGGNALAGLEKEALELEIDSAASGLTATELCTAALYWSAGHKLKPRYIRGKAKNYPVRITNTETGTWVLAHRPGEVWRKSGDRVYGAVLDENLASLTTAPTLTSTTAT